MSVTPEVLDWVRKAEADLAAAHRLADGGRPLPDQMGFLCQQAAEKYLKAFLLAVGQVPPRIHDVDVLLEMCTTVDPGFDRLRPLVEGLTEFAVVYRYPGEWSDVATARHALVQAEQVRTLVREKLNIGREEV